MDKAIEWLSTRSQKVAAAKSGRLTKQGLVGMAISPDASSAALVQLNCETDFVARNVDFQTVVNEIATLTLQGKELPATLVSDLVGKFRENIVLGNRSVLRASAGGLVGSYLHGKLGPGVGTLGALVSLAGGPQTLADQLALHVAGANPRYLKRDEMPIEERNAEESKIKAGESNKPPQVQAKIVQGKLQKFYGEHCLEDQNFIVGELEGTPISQLLKGAKIEGFLRLALAK